MIIDTYVWRRRGGADNPANLCFLAVDPRPEFGAVLIRVSADQPKPLFLGTIVVDPQPILGHGDRVAVLDPACVDSDVRSTGDEGLQPVDPRRPSTIEVEPGALECQLGARGVAERFKASAHDKGHLKDQRAFGKKLGKRSRTHQHPVIPRN